MTDLLGAPVKAASIAANSIEMFRDRYLTPAAIACYWRRMFQRWSEVSFGPELFIEVLDGADGKAQKRTRGREYEFFVADFTTSPTLD